MQLVIERISAWDVGDLAPLVVLADRTIEKDYGWVFFYTSKLYVETRDIRYALVGIGPIVVEKDGTMTQLGSGRPLKQLLREFEDAHVA